MKSLLMRIFGGEEVHGRRTLSAWKLGAAFLVGVLLVGLAFFNKTLISTVLHPGETLKVHFATDYRLRPYFSQVKISFVPVGMVTGVEEQDDKTAMVTIKIFDNNRDKMGTEPTAVIRPTTLLGGNYFVDLIPGGDPGRYQKDQIEVDHTRLPVELDKITRALQPDALAGTRGFITKFDNTLHGGGTAALQRLVADAPSALTPTGQVLDALRGNDPSHDLTNVVHGLEATSRELANPRGRLDSILTDLASTSAVFGARGSDVSYAIDELPGSLHSAQKGLHRLDHTLDDLKDTAEDVRPTARELRHTLDKLDPVIRRARPVVSDLRDVLEDARPLVEKLVPDLRDARDLLDDFHGPVLDRVNGPIANLILNPFHGTGPFRQTNTDKPIYQELGYAVANLDRATNMSKNGGSLPFEPLPYPEGETLFQNDGQGRVETLPRTVSDPNRINPPIQSPGKAPAPQDHSPLLPMMGGSSAGGDK